MSLIAITCWDTITNNRTQLTEKTLNSLKETVDFSRHRLFVFDNASCYDTKRILKSYQEVIPNMTVITSEENVGTANGINACWKNRNEKEHLLKCDNDVVFKQSGWLDLLEEAIERSPNLGQAAMKRKDLDESPDNEHPFYKSELVMLPHEKGQRWITAELVKHCMGTCVLHNYRLIDKVGALVQMEGKYGFDDALMSLRSTIAGFKNAFIHGVEIDHLDVADDGGYTKWKIEYSGQMMDKFNQYRTEYLNGTRNIYQFFE